MLGRDGAAGIARAFLGSAVNRANFPPEIIAHYRENALKPGALTAMINYYRANFPAVLDEPAALIEVPVLMVWGEQDLAIDIANTQGYEGLVSDFTLVRLADASHWVQQDAPDAVNAAMVAWLAARGEKRL
jgi:pimeloyl-ACP methyl ester carboxylesterase